MQPIEAGAQTPQPHELARSPPKRCCRWPKWSSPPVDMLPERRRRRVLLPSREPILPRNPRWGMTHSARSPSAGHRAERIVRSIERTGRGDRRGARASRWLPDPAGVPCAGIPGLVQHFGSRGHRFRRGFHRRVPGAVRKPDVRGVRSRHDWPGTRATSGTRTQLLQRHGSSERPHPLDGHRLSARGPPGHAEAAPARLCSRGRRAVLLGSFWSVRPRRDGSNPSDRQLLWAHDEVAIRSRSRGESAEVDGESRYLWLRADHEWSEALSGSLWFGHSQIDSLRRGTLDNSGIAMGSVADSRASQFWDLRGQMQWQLQPAHYMEAGFEATSEHATYRYVLGRMYPADIAGCLHESRLSHVASMCRLHGSASQSSARTAGDSVTRSRASWA